MHRSGRASTGDRACRGLATFSHPSDAGSGCNGWRPNARHWRDLNHWQVLRGRWPGLHLRANEQALLARMGVFEGGCTIEAAEAVCAESRVENEEWSKVSHESSFLHSSFSILQSIQSLLNKNLLLQEQWSSNESRYMMLDMIHQFALARLSERGETS
jgi:predicted ATPase